MSDLRSRGQSALRSALVAGMVLVGGTALPAAAQGTSESAQVTSPAECVVGYGSVGRAMVGAFLLDVPYPNESGGPYVENEINAIPKGYALASEAFEGNLGEIVLGTTGVYPENQTTARAYYPAVQHGGTEATIDHSPISKSVARITAGPEAYAFGAAFGQRGAAPITLGPSFAEITTAFDGTTVRGVDVASGYNVTLGDAVISQLRSVVEYETSGREQDTKATWRLEFFGIHQAGAPRGQLTGDGIVLQGSTPAPGPSGRQQFDNGVRQLSEALKAAGIGHLHAEVHPGSITIQKGKLKVEGAGFLVRATPRALEGGVGHGVGFTFAKTVRTAEVQLDRCETAVQPLGPFPAVQAPPPNLTPGGEGYGGPKSLVSPRVRVTAPVETCRASLHSSTSAGPARRPLASARPAPRCELSDMPSTASTRRSDRAPRRRRSSPRDSPVDAAGRNASRSTLVQVGVAVWCGVVWWRTPRTRVAS